ncbi:hypothetical protein D9M71_372430 [compost metagenome]
MSWPDFFQPGNAEKVKTLREREVFLQDAVAIKDVLWIRQQGVVGAEPWECDAICRQPTNLAIDGHADMLEVLRNPQVKRASGSGIAAEVKVEAGTAQAVQRPLDQ